MALGTGAIRRWVLESWPVGTEGTQCVVSCCLGGEWRTGCGSGSLFATVHSFVLRGKWCLWFAVAFAIGQAWRAASAR
jgi:hypothetical protein